MKHHCYILLCQILIQHTIFFTRCACFFFRKRNLLQKDLTRTCLQYYTRSGHHNHLNHIGSLEKEPFYKLSQLRKHHTTRTNHKCNKSWVELWKDRLHFVSLPVYDFGNWIPYSLMHWPCFGSGCALAQVVIKSMEGTTQSHS